MTVKVTKSENPYGTVEFLRATDTQKPRMFMAKIVNALPDAISGASVSKTVFKAALGHVIGLACKQSEELNSAVDMVSDAATGATVRKKVAEATLGPIFTLGKNALEKITND